MQRLLILVASLATVSWAETRTPTVVEIPIRYDLRAPEETEKEAMNRMSRTPGQRQIIYQTFLEMPEDHFDPHNSNTFQMRYMFNEEFFTKPGDPIFIMVGGEWTITAGFLVTGNMFEMARENRGYMIYTEHRYYGVTLPYSNFTTENLRFLNVDQALADLAYFITEIKKRPEFTNSSVILYGCSYAANMATWFKQRYPHLVKGVVASSGPIKAEVDFQGYLKVVHEAFLSEGGEQCIETIRQGIRDTVQAMQTENGRLSLESSYRLCSPLDYDDPLALGYFSGLISWTFSRIVQTATPGQIISVCNNFSDFSFGITPMQKVGGFVAWAQGLSPAGCWSMAYQDLVNTYSQNNNNRAWYYQTCTEYGYYQTAPTTNTVFDPLVWLDVDFYVDICQKAFSERFNKDFVYDAADRVNLMFGGRSPNVNNTITIHGVIDPWRYLGVFDRDLKESSPTFDTPRFVSRTGAELRDKKLLKIHRLPSVPHQYTIGASHCFDVREWSSTDTIRMTAVQQKARRLIAQWLAD